MLRKQKIRKDHIQCTGPHIYSSNKLKYCWVSVPKCGSCTIATYLEKHARWNHHEHSSSHEGWQDYFKFAFVRNPWDRLYSCYRDKVYNGAGGCTHYLRSFNKRRSSFADFVRTIAKPDNILKDRHFSPFHTLLINKDFRSMDFIGKVENFEEDFNFVCDKLGIPQQKLPHENRSKHKHYTEYYDDETRQIVAEKYAKDIEYFDYKFGE